MPSLPFSSSAVALKAPKDCKGQQNESEYATLSGSLNTAGGSFCIPAYAGYGGKLKYPTVDPSVKFTLSTSTQNWDNFESLLSGTPIFYLEFSISGATRFGDTIKKGGGLTGAGLTAGDDYTLIGQIKVFGQKLELGPCYTTATKGRFGGVIGGLGSLVKGEDLPTSASGYVEIYDGKETSTPC
jgi:hypothetical protein